jgi:hypothetical protein
MQNLHQDSNQDRFAEKIKIDQPEKAINCLKQLQSCTSIMSDGKPNFAQDDSRSESLLKIEPSLHFNRPLKLNTDQKFELQSA